MGEFQINPAKGSAKVPQLWAVSVIVPVFNEEDGVAQTLDELQKVLAQMEYQIGRASCRERV